jgi:hypothetical protein
VRINRAFSRSPGFQVGKAIRAWSAAFYSGATRPLPPATLPPRSRRIFIVPATQMCGLFGARIGARQHRFTFHRRGRWERRESAITSASSAFSAVKKPLWVVEQAQNWGIFINSPSFSAERWATIPATVILRADAMSMSGLRSSSVGVRRTPQTRLYHRGLVCMKITFSDCHPTIHR